MNAGNYVYTASVKGSVSDELVNTYLMRPAAGVLVGFLYRTPVTPNQVTVAAMIAGLVAAILYAQGSPLWTAVAGILISCKDLLDSADGQLARAKGAFSRAGRFLDSLGDITVNFAACAAIAWAFLQGGAGFWVVPAWGAAFLFVSLRVSYHVYYQTSFLHLNNAYTGNRTSEELRGEDLSAGRGTLALQRVFLVLYGWQDRLVARLDNWSREGIGGGTETGRRWYGDVTGVRWSGFIGLGTELLLLTLCSVINHLNLYLYLNLIGMNAVWASCIAYRRVVLRRRLRAVIVPGRPS
ncbi:MAG: CDP-alcohol phosphatidyltransferase family protein [Bacteroidota bacterium]